MSQNRFRSDERVFLKRYVNWNKEKVEKEVKDVKLQIRRAAEFLQNSFPGGAEVVLFEANLARSPALRSFLIEKSMDAE